MTTTPDTSQSAGHDTDVVVVGGGPVGLAMARSLGLAGHDVVVLERWPAPYPLPRAVHFDDEIGRFLASLGLTQQVEAISAGVPDHYEWRNAAGESLVRIDWSGDGPNGWPVASFFSQPQLEAVLDEAARDTPSVELRRGAEVVDLDEDPDGVTVTYRSPDGTEEGAPQSIRARFVVGCDGANSFVRRAMGTTMHDDGFFFDWLIVDTIPQEPADEQHWSPQNWQLCDPARPTTIVSGGPGRRRWEFMRLDGETREELDNTEKAWSLLEPWGRTPENTTLERHAVYTFAARWAQEWTRGRLAIAGDAAHQMPPFAGQGMCSGLRDVANLSWKLDRVLRGESDLDLLQTYTSERSTHIGYAIELSIALGRVICVLDEKAAAERDARMIAGGADPRVVMPMVAQPVLGPGVIASDAGLPEVGGTMTPQFPVSTDSGQLLLDEATGPGATLLIDGRRADETGFLPAATGGVTLHVIGGQGAGVPAADGVWGDPTGAWAGWFDNLGAMAVLVRPDRYAFGATDTGDEVGVLLARYASALEPAHANGSPSTTTPPAGAPASAH